MARMLLWHVGLALAIVSMFGMPVHAQKMTPSENEPDHIRGQLTELTASSMVITTKDGKTVTLAYDDSLTVITLEKDSFTKVDFGTYVGAVAVKLDAYSPIVRDSMSWLHRGFEFRIIDEALRGIAAGHKKWDLTPETVIAHGWVDDIEDRVLSIKYGPTEEEETDVEIGRDIPVQRMKLGEKSILKAGIPVFAGAQKGGDGNYKASFVFVGKGGVVPAL